MKHILSYDHLNESSYRYSHNVRVGRIIRKANEPNRLIRINGNTPDEFVSKLNGELMKHGEEMMDIEIINKVKARLAELENQPEPDPYPPAVMKELKRLLHYYDGNFPFLLSTRKQLKQRGKLSRKQWEGVYRSLYR